MSNLKQEVIVREIPKKGSNSLDCYNLYVTNAVVFYPVVHEPKKGYNTEEREFGLTAFVTEAVKDQLLDDVMVNKSFLQVGKDKTSKPPRRIKYPLSSQTEEGKVNYDEVEGMFGFSVSRPEFSKKGTPMRVNVIDTEGNQFTENVGNGSVCNIKLFGYKNQDGQLVVQLDTVQVVKHVPYENSGNGGEAGTIVDDVLGVSYKVPVADKTSAQEQAAPKQQAPVQQGGDFAAFDDDIPF